MLPNTVYEFRVGYKNETGSSEYSLSSRRARTNRATLPTQSNPPSILEFSSSSAIILLDLPIAGSDVIIQFIVETKDTRRNYVRQEIFVYNPSLTSTSTSNTNSTNTPQKRVSIVGIKTKQQQQQLLQQAPLTFTIENLIPRNGHCFRSWAVTGVGTGPPSNWSEEIELPPVV